MYNGQLKNVLFLMVSFAILMMPELALAADPPGTKNFAKAVLEFLSTGSTALLAGTIMLAILGYKVWRGTAELEDAVKFAIGAMLVYGAAAVIAWIMTKIRTGG